MNAGLISNSTQTHPIKLPNYTPSVKKQHPLEIPLFPKSKETNSQKNNQGVYVDGKSEGNNTSIFSDVDVDMENQKLDPLQTKPETNVNPKPQEIVVSNPLTKKKTR